MTAVGYVVKTMVLTIDPDPGGTPVAYECAITAVNETASNTTQTSQTACPDGTITDVGPTSWSIDIVHNVSLMPASLHRILRENEGKSATVVIEPFPVAEPGQKISWDVTLVPPGGSYPVGSFAVSTATLPVKGSPVHIDPGP
jgi:hypothetical protein